MYPQYQAIFEVNGPLAQYPPPHPIQHPPPSRWSQITKLCKPWIRTTVDFLGLCLYGLMWVILGIAALYLCLTVFSVLFICLGTALEWTIVGLFGRAVYNKNFPVCSNTIYQGNGCYTTQNVYCN